MNRDAALDRLVTPLVLAGGLGTRLAPVLPDTPKVLAPVAGRPFLTYLLDDLERAGFSRVVLCLGHRAEAVMAVLERRPGGLRLDVSREPAPLGTAGALRLALGQVETPWLLVQNGDSRVAHCPGAFARWHLTAGHPASLLAVRVPDAARYGRLESGASGRVRAFVEKDGRHQPGTIYAGLAMLPRPAIEAVSPDRFVQLENAVLPRLAAEGRLFAQTIDAPFIDIGTPESYARVRETAWPPA